MVSVEGEVIDLLDHRLLRHIRLHLFQSGREIARALEVTDSTTRNRLNKLEAEGYLGKRTIGIWPYAHLWFVSVLGMVLLRGLDTVEERARAIGERVYNEADG